MGDVVGRQFGEQAPNVAVAVAVDADADADADAAVLVTVVVEICFVVAVEAVVAPSVLAIH
jgi:hypothetical protein